eukprot:3292632-Rhodomonas_salina.1
MHDNSGWDNTVRKWDVSADKFIAEFLGHQANSLFSPLQNAPKRLHLSYVAEILFQLCYSFLYEMPGTNMAHRHC